jgi:hypothetical protein
MRFHAVETIHLRKTEFGWRATVGPLGWLSVVDALRNGEAELEVRAFRCIRLAGERGGAAAAKGEIMRYLAELAWAPDAMLTNPALAWTVIDDRVLRVSTGWRGVRAEVELRLDQDGRIASVQADDRPRKEGASFVERPWRGRFFDYRPHQGRLLPFGGEVGWILDGQAFVTWRGQVVSWRAD